MECTLDTKALYSLRKLVGNNDDLYGACFAETVGAGNKPTTGFANWYGNTKGKSLDTIKSDNTKAKAILEYHYFLHPDGNATVVGDTRSIDVLTFGYTDSVAKEFAKKFISNQILVVASSEQARSIKDDRQRKDFVIGKVKNKIKALLVDRIANIKNISREEAILEYKKGIKHLDSIFDSEDVNLQDKNLYALFNETIARSRVDGNPEQTLAGKLFTEAFRDDRLHAFNFPKDKNDENSAEDAADEEDTSDPNKVDSEEDLSRDETIGNFEHSGVYSSYEKHVSDKIGLYLSTIPKLVSVDGNRQTRKNDVNNPLGVQDFHDKKEIVSLLYSGIIDYTNRKTMIDSIRRVAETNRNFSGLIAVVEDLNSNFNLACEMYSVFSKKVITKQAIHFGGGETTITSNAKNISRDANIIFGFLNDARHTAINIDKSFVDSAITGINVDIDRVYKNTKDGNVVKDEAKEYKLINDVASLKI